jgi:serine/threonine protein kinase
MEDLTGKTLDQYQITGPIGEGGMAAVYKAYQPGVDRYVALKVLPRHFASDPQFVKRFNQEARIIAKLQHPHILPVFDYGEADGYTYIVMPFVKAGTVADFLTGDPLSLEKICQIMSQLGDALDYAHSQGIIHRDIKPSNVLVDERGNCLLTDFGIGKILAGNTQLTSTGDVIGTPAYMSPEQGLGGDIDARSDIYSLGVMLYEMVTGRQPYKAETPMAVIVKHIYDPLPPPRTINPGIPEPIERVVLKALAKHRDQRFQTPGDLVASLEKAAATAKDGRAVSNMPLPQETVVSQPEPREYRVPQTSRSQVTPARRLSIPRVFFGMVGLGIIGVIVVLGGLFLINRLLITPKPEATPVSTAAEISTATQTQPSPTPSQPVPTVTSLAFQVPDVLKNPAVSVFDAGGLVYLGPAAVWSEDPGFVDKHQADLLVDPKGIFERVVRLSVTGYGHGEQTASFTLWLEVPEQADIVSIPVATALNGTVDESDSESGMEILVRDPANGQESWTYAAYMLETEFGVPYALGFADVSLFQGQRVQLSVTLRQVDVCAGSQCTQNADFFIGDLFFGELPDICTTLSDGQLINYDYYDDPTPQEVESCAQPQPYYFIDIEDGPYNTYGSGESTYSIPFALPDRAELIEFRMYYGYHARELIINHNVISPQEIYQAFPYRSGLYLNIAEPSRYSLVNNNPALIAPYLDWGKNNLSVTVFTENAWEERPFDVFLRFKVPVP